MFNSNVPISVSAICSSWVRSGLSWISHLPIILTHSVSSCQSRCLRPIGWDSFNPWKKRHGADRRIFSFLLYISFKLEILSMQGGTCHNSCIDCWDPFLLGNSFHPRIRTHPIGGNILYTGDASGGALFFRTEVTAFILILNCISPVSIEKKIFSDIMGSSYFSGPSCWA